MAKYLVHYFVSNNASPSGYIAECEMFDTYELAEDFARAQAELDPDAGTPFISHYFMRSGGTRDYNMSRRSVANRRHPEGCKCTSTDSGGECDWCMIYYGLVD